MPDNAPEIQAVTQPLQQTERDAVLALWAAENAELNNPDARLAQVDFLAYAGETLVGVSTAKLVHEPHTQQPLYALRALVRKDYQAQLPAFDLFLHSVEARGNASADGSDRRAVGVLIEIDAPFAAEQTRFDARQTFENPATGTALNFYYIGFNERGFREYIHYFPGARIHGIEKAAPGAGTTAKAGKAQSKKPRGENYAPKLQLELVHGDLTTAQQEEVIQLWLDGGLLPDIEACMKRIPQVAALACQNDSIVGIGSVFPVLVPRLQVKLLGYRSFISPHARGGQAATELLNLIFADRNERFVNSKPGTRLPGMLYTLQNAQLNASVVDAISPRTGFLLAGFDKDNRQIRLRYFDSAVLRLEKAP